MEQQVSSCVRQVRTRLELTQAQLAGRVGVTRQTIIAIEKGNYTPSVLLALKLAKVLGCSVESLFSCVEESAEAIASGR
ncbi:helix-turn-helix transcriptional regulator [Spirochaeta africana]|nr:helix-turn-helix transcriptional regulator [Spirochaeta africana]